MNTLTNSESNSRRFAHVGIIFAILGLLLFAHFVRKAGISEIGEGIKRLGVAFLLILGISAIRYLARSLAWVKCVEPPYRLPFRDAFAARLMGDALGNIVPLTSVAVAEPSKAAFVRDRVPLMAGLSAVALENIFYSLSVGLLIFSGTSALLLSFPLPKPLRFASIALLVTTASLTLLGYLVIHKQWKFLSDTLSFLSKHGVRTSWLQKAIPRAETLEARIYGFYDRNRGRLLPIFALELCFHLAGIAEVYTTLWFISDVLAPTLLAAFILESVNRVINVVFKFVPLRTGVDEAGTGMLSSVLGFTTAIGVTLAIIRKARDIFWATIGVALMAHRGLSVKGVSKNTEEAVALSSAAAEAPSLPAGDSG